MNTIKIHVLHCGSVWVDRAVPFYEKNVLSNCIKVIANHDPELKPQVIEL